MSDTEVIDAEIVDEPQHDVRAEIQNARALIPVTQGVTPANFAQMVDFAKTMALARNALPAHLRNNAGDCLAIIDISAKVGLSPYMVANKTYVQNNRLCFESQLFHAFAQSSGLLKGDLHVDYEGEGEETICIVRGFLKGDPREKIHKSPPLKDVRPKRNAAGVVKGSPLWDRKPLVQLFYDTSRDWVRIYAPRATLGIYTPDEMQDYAEPQETVPKLQDQFAKADRSEGHKAGHVDTELANVASNTDQPPEDVTPKKTKQAKSKKRTEAEKPVEEKGPPKTAAQYADYCSAWIEKETDRDTAEARWEGEFDMRTELSVPIKDRNELRAKLDAKFGDKE